MVHEDCMKLGASNKFNSLEKPKQLKLILDPWTQDNDMLTPTFKLKRNIAKKMYDQEILDLYAAPVLGKKK
jgi:long-chain acyl-CoA synthetase